MKTPSLSLGRRVAAIAVRRAARFVMVAIAAIAILIGSDWLAPQSAAAYPFWAQEVAPETPREATGRIVCANCHLASKPTQVEIPQSVTPNTVFEAVVKIPYDTSIQQVTGTGEPGPLNVGAVLMLPEGFKIAPEDRIPEELKEKTEGLFYQPYAADQENTVIIGPLPGDDYQEIVFPVLSPDPSQDSSLHFGKYAVHVGGNRGRGQVYPAGNNTNNTVYNASATGQITAIANTDDGGAAVSITQEDGSIVEDVIPAGPTVIVSEGDSIQAGAPLTNNPNVGGFGQADTEIVLQDPNRVKWLLAFFTAVTLAQILLVLKKKQVEKVQAAEGNF